MGVTTKTGALLVTLATLAACASTTAPDEEIVYSAEWFSCSSRFQCVVVYDAYCQSTAVNRRYSLVYQDWALQEVILAGQRRPCPEPEMYNAVPACHDGRCTYPIPIGRRDRSGENPE